MFRAANRVTVMCVCVWLLTASGPAFAYLDPGTGSIILQGIVAALAAIGVTARFYWHRVLHLFGRKEPGDQKRISDEEQDKRESDISGSD